MIHAHAEAKKNLKNVTEKNFNLKNKKTMKKIIFKLAAPASILLLSAFTLGDACSSLVFFKEGTSATMTSYNDDGKVTGSTKTLYTKVNKTTTGASVTAQQESFDKKGKPSSKSEYTINCEGGVLKFDMKMMIPQQQQESYKDMEMTMDGTNLEFPASMEPGTTLKDANVTIKVTSNGMPMPMMNMSIKITDRKVEAKESVTTAAGTFECYRISENFETKTMFSIKGKSVNWFSYEVGTVKTESYKEKGKLVGKTELTELKK